MPELSSIKSLAMLKMEKKFVAHMEKHKPRQPYETLTTCQLLDRLEVEAKELIDAWKNQDINGARLECADVSNIVDYIFERLCNGRIH